MAADVGEVLSICIGWEPREAASFAVFRRSLERRTSRPLHIIPLMQQALRYNGLYRRKHEIRDGITYDVISDAPMATEFSITRFLSGILAHSGWVLFAEPDMLCLADPAKLFALADPRYALMCVQHAYEPAAAEKMDAQKQVTYARKNWSSLMLINQDHAANKRLTVEMVNALPGRDLHRFCWLDDQDIGALPVEWNYLVGEAMPKVRPKLLHYTNGTPELVPDTAYSAPWLLEAELLKVRRIA